MFSLCGLTRRDWLPVSASLHRDIGAKLTTENKELKQNRNPAWITDFTGASLPSIV